VNENRRYAISSKDKMDNDYHRYIFTYGMDLSPTSNLVGKVYKAKYSRNWKKVGSISVDADGDASTGGDIATVSMGSIDWDNNGADLTGRNLRAHNIVTNATAMIAGESISRALGHRDYGMYGYDLRYNTVIGNHDIKIGYRKHTDYRIRNDQYVGERYTLGSNNTMTLLYGDYETEVSGDTDYAFATSISLIDRISHGNFTTTLGLRHEDVDYADIAKVSGTATDRNNDKTMIAASTVYDMGNGKSAFIGYSQGYMPTGAGSGVVPEESDNYEIGYRSISANSHLEIIGFYTDYENLNETCNASGGCTIGTDGQKSAGEAHAQGVEFLYRVNNLFAAPQMKGAANTGSGVRYPMILAVTLQEAEHDVTTGSSFKDGARIKYTPEEIYYLSLGMETNAWDMNISAKYNDDVMNTGKSTAVKTDSAWIYDFRAGMNLDGMGMQGARAFLNVDNLFDKSYIASAHNYGVRPNKPQTVMAGISFDF
jgi:Fe(3+) dicitrate transport protein